MWQWSQGTEDEVDVRVHRHLLLQRQAHVGHRRSLQVEALHPSGRAGGGGRAPVVRGHGLEKTPEFLHVSPPKPPPTSATSTTKQQAQQAHQAVLPLLFRLQASVLGLPYPLAPAAPRHLLRRPAAQRSAHPFDGSGSVGTVWSVGWSATLRPRLNSSPAQSGTALTW